LIHLNKFLKVSDVRQFQETLTYLTASLGLFSFGLAKKSKQKTKDNSTKEM